ncbi:MAG: hypothetical protein K9H14_01255 [Actinomycetia bacterium]|nr:hypothetical protein [Actinomycetes bacterium]
MGLFGKKKIERPKNPLGVALYDYDRLIKTRFKKIIAYIKAEKPLKTEKVEKVLDRSIPKMEDILEHISKENLKIDYRSDKIRYKIIDMVNDIIKFFKEAIEYKFDYEKVDTGMLERVLEKREQIKKDMKEIESDYL